MSPCNMCLLVLVLASALPPCGALTALASVRSAALADGAARSGGGSFSSSQDSGETLHLDFVPAYSSNVPIVAEILIACVWAGLVACAPLLVRYLDRRPVGAERVKAASACWVGTFCFMYLFTSIILFQSAHFDGVRPLSIAECVYFMSQVVTTVGYGDITPARPTGQVLVGCFVLCALFVIAVLFSELVEHVQGATRRYEEQAAACRETEQAPGEEPEEAFAAVTDNSAKHSRPPSPWPLVYSILFFGLFAFSWVFFFHFWPGEEKTWTDAFFMSAITLSTVGLGDVTPATEAGMIFAAFWMLFGGAALSGAVADFASLMACLKSHTARSAWSPTWSRVGDHVARQDPEAWQETFSRFSKSLDGDQVTEADFIRWGLMQHGLVAEDDLGDIKRGYAQLTAPAESLARHVAVGGARHGVVGAEP